MSDVLIDGLLWKPDVNTADGTSTPQSVVDRVEEARSLLRLPEGFETAAEVAYTPESRQVVVEDELHRDNVIPRVKTYRSVKSRGVVRSTPRAAAQIRSLYAGAIAH